MSAVVHFYSFSTVYIKDQKKQVNMIRKYHNHTLQTKTRSDIIMQFIKQRNQFHYERILYAQKCASVSVPFVPNVVVEHVSGFVDDTLQVDVTSYLWVMCHMMLVSVYAISVIL